VIVVIVHLKTKSFYFAMLLVTMKRNHLSVSNAERNLPKLVFFVTTENDILKLVPSNADIAKRDFTLQISFANMSVFIPEKLLFHVRTAESVLSAIVTYLNINEYTWKIVQSSLQNNYSVIVERYLQLNEISIGTRRENTTQYQRNANFVAKYLSMVLV
jgi:hypothetical protein